MVRPRPASRGGRGGTERGRGVSFSPRPLVFPPRPLRDILPTVLHTRSWTPVETFDAGAAGTSGSADPTHLICGAFRRERAGDVVAEKKRRLDAGGCLWRTSRQVTQIV